MKEEKEGQTTTENKRKRKMSPCATAVESVRRRQQYRELRAFVQLLEEENRNQP